MIPRELGRVDVRIVPVHLRRGEGELSPRSKEDVVVHLARAVLCSDARVALRLLSEPLQGGLVLRASPLIGKQVNLGWRSGLRDWGRQAEWRVGYARGGLILRVADLPDVVREAWLSFAGVQSVDGRRLRI